MKKICSTVFTILTLGLSSLCAQNRVCGTMDNLERLKAQDPKMELRMRELENFTQDYVNQNSVQKTNLIVNIPVVVHVVYNTTAQNISDAQVQSQIAVLNEDFRRLNADKTNTPSAFSSIAADCEINFCLATKDANGNATTGITRTSTSTTSFSDNDNVKHNSTGGKDAWPSDKYLNLWVCNLGSSLLGYAQFPGGPASTDGVVIHYKYFGRNGSAVAPFNKGRTATHEVGHWLNLYHIWGDDGGACTGSDNVSDTPNQGGEHYGCPAFPTSSCSNGSNGDMFMNYMDYTDDACMNMFSAGQKARMQALFASGGARVGLLSSAGCGGSSTTTPVYCNSNGTNTSYEWISNVKLNTINNTSGANSGYGNYTAVSTTLTKGSSYTVNLTPSFSGTAYSEYFNVYIDYNNDKDFADAGELVYSSSGSSAAVSGTFTIPSTASSASTRMRVIMKDAAITGPCEVYTYGETEDYSVNITTGTSTSCGTPGSLSAGSVTSTSATLNWTAVSGAASYNIRYKSTASTNWTTTSATSTSKSISGLSGSTVYEFQVQAVCSSTGAYSASATFTTLNSAGTTNNVTIGTGTGVTGVTPYGTYYSDERSQFIITKSELVAAGYTSANSVIKSLAFYVTTASAQAMNGFTIKISHTTASAFSSTTYLSGTNTTTVYSGTFTAGANQWNTHTFTLPFMYNGTDNLLIDICWDNSSYTSNSSTQYTATSAYRTLYKRSDLSTSGLCSATTGTQSYNRPNMKFGFSSNSTARMEDNTNTIAIVNSDLNLKLYPNPAVDNFTISYHLAKESKVSVMIYNITGALITKVNEADLAEGDYQQTISLSGSAEFNEIPSGIYLCSVSIDGTTTTKRFIINR